MGTTEIPHRPLFQIPNFTISGVLPPFIGASGGAAANAVAQRSAAAIKTVVRCMEVSFLKSRDCGWVIEKTATT